MKTYDKLITEISESVLALQELKDSTLGSYIGKAVSDRKNRIEHGKELDELPKVKKQSEKLTDYYGRREYTKTGASKYEKQIMKAHSEKDRLKREADPNYPESVRTYKRDSGIDAAIDKLRKGKSQN